MFSRWPSVWLSAHPSVVRTSVRTSFPFDNLSIINRFHSDFAYALVPTMSCLELLMGKFTHLSLVNVQKMCLTSSSFTNLSIMMKLHKK